MEISCFMEDIDLCFINEFYSNFDTSVNNAKGEGKGSKRDFFVDGFRVLVEGLDFCKVTVGEDS